MGRFADHDKNLQSTIENPYLGTLRHTPVHEPPSRSHDDLELIFTYF